MYQKKIERGELPIMNGHLLHEEDTLLRKNILELMCAGKTVMNNRELDEEFLHQAIQKLKLLEEDNLVTLNGNAISVTDKGAIFIRNICASIDARLWRNSSDKNVFSKTI